MWGKILTYDSFIIYDETIIFIQPLTSQRGVAYYDKVVMTG